MRVDIVGAGAAGLMAALTLRVAGVSVRIFEARDRVGGRIWTRDDAGYDPGGEWIDSDHPVLLSLVERFGLKLRESDGERWIFRGGSILKDSDPSLQAADLAFAEAVRGLRPNETDTVDDFLRALKLDEEWWIRAQIVSDEGEDLDRIGLANWARSYEPYLTRQGGELSAYRLVGGMGRLTDAMAEGVEIIHRRVESLEELDGDHVILAVPPFAQLDLAGHLLSEAERQTLEQTPMARCMKVACRFETSWWRRHDWNGEGHWDGAIQQTWEGGEGILIAYICGDQAIAAPTPVEMVHEMAAYFPEAREEFIEGWVHPWTHDSLARGAFSVRPPGLDPSLAPRRSGKVHFAGEHLGQWYGFIEGALESGQSAARAILES